MTYNNVIICNNAIKNGYLDGRVVILPEHLEEGLKVGHFRVVVDVDSLGEVALKICNPPEQSGQLSFADAH
jgi:hypothetical protein